MNRKPFLAFLSLCAVVAFAGTPPARANLVLNGGFETVDDFDGIFHHGDMEHWTGGGAIAEESYFAAGPYDNVNSGPHSGNLAAAFATPSTDLISPRTIQQDIATVQDYVYRVSFWLSVQQDPGTPNFFSASFGGTPLFSGQIPAPSVWTEYSFDVTAASALSTLSFTATSDPSAVLLDDVSVVPEPSTYGALMGVGLLLVGVGSTLRRKRLAVA